MIDLHAGGYCGFLIVSTQKLECFFESQVIHLLDKRENIPISSTGKTIKITLINFQTRSTVTSVKRAARETAPIHMDSIPVQDIAHGICLLDLFYCHMRVLRFLHISIHTP